MDTDPNALAQEAMPSPMNVTRSSSPTVPPPEETMTLATTTSLQADSVTISMMIDSGGSTAFVMSGTGYAEDDRNLATITCSADGGPQVLLYSSLSSRSTEFEPHIHEENLVGLTRWTTNSGW